MKRSKSKILTVLFAATLAASAFGGALSLSNIAASAAATYSLTDVFRTESGAKVEAFKPEDSDEVTATRFTFENGSAVSLKRDLALKWYAEKDKPSYLSVSFTFLDTNFDKMTLAFESAPATSVEDDKAENRLVFEKNGSALSVKVNDGEAKDVSTDVTLTLSQKDGETVAGYGEFFVFINDVNVGTFENVGANYARYSTSSSSAMTPVKFSAELPKADGEEKPTTQIELKEINGQKFDSYEGDYLTDTAAPVLVVNEEITSFVLGMPFELDCEVIDVLESSPYKKTEFYQYSPKDEDIKYTDLDSTTYFFDSKDVFKEEGREFVAIKYTLSDRTFTTDENAEQKAVECQLGWYAENPVSPKGEHAAALDEVPYISVERDDDTPVYRRGPYYKLLALKKEDGEWKNEKQEGYDAFVEDYQARVTKAAEDVKAGYDSYVYLPSLKGIIEDNDTGYGNLKFSIYYRTKDSDNQSSTNLNYSDMRLSVSTVGDYEFKVIATDRASHDMYYALDGRYVKVASDNVWKIDEIPSFTFHIEKNELKIDENKDTVSKAYLDVSYTSTDFSVKGVGNPTKEYSLYYFDVQAFASKYGDGVPVSDKDITKVQFSYLKEAAENLSDKTPLQEDAEGFFVERYLTKFIEELHLNKEVTAKNLLDEGIFRKIEKYDSSIDKQKHEAEWNASDNKYHWEPSSRSFRPQEEGKYLFFTVVTDEDLFGEKICAYRAVNVDAKSDVIPGDSYWLQNNIASVVLFSIAGVLLLFIIVLLFIKPSDESLEEVGQGKRSKKEKKAKKK